MKQLPEVQFITTKEDAYARAEELAAYGFAVEIKSDGNIFRLEMVENFNQGQKLCQPISQF